MQTRNPGPAGRRLIADMGALATDARTRELVDQAAHCADRAARWQQVVDGDEVTWGEVVQARGRVTLHVDAVHTHLRGEVNLLRQLVLAIHAATPGAATLVGETFSGAPDALAALGAPGLAETAGVAQKGRREARR